MTFTLPKISFFKRYVKILFSWGNLGLIFYYVVCCIVPILSGKMDFFVFAVICCIPLLITLIRPIFIADKLPLKMLLYKILSNAFFSTKGIF
jgi:hypothetical protein